MPSEVPRQVRAHLYSCELCDGLFDQLTEVDKNGFVFCICQGCLDQKNGVRHARPEDFF